jgi:hypothetical protein
MTLNAIDTFSHFEGMFRHLNSPCILLHGVPPVN